MKDEKSLVDVRHVQLGEFEAAGTGFGVNGACIWLDLAPVEWSSQSDLRALLAAGMKRL